MPASYNFTKVSGVVRISSTVQGSFPAKSYFGATGNVTYLGTVINLTVGKDNYQFEYNNIQVNGQTPSTLSEAITLLTSIFGT